MNRTALRLRGTATASSAGHRWRIVAKRLTGSIDPNVIAQLSRFRLDFSNQPEVFLCVAVCLNCCRPDVRSFARLVDVWRGSASRSWRYVRSAGRFQANVGDARLVQGSPSQKQSAMCGCCKNMAMMDGMKSDDPHKGMDMQKQ